ncbi:hypothetical protein [Singulisphaera acidiphila]|uniref:Uncharacterized protein n=1 Tax=Singulisphaera acidiphila (strain ATCC BAA-1392 / DSM 18658 / VKM B-2454 / MOB10) TaxID=886293 RepID=L0DRN7_SINAD|nr:hypothetical protein [Singulisphaera acidiphila]AGA31660.1 hypothetical protein Sinac_7629 [Singulisphaera acidiphila DSM 18658]
MADDAELLSIPDKQAVEPVLLWKIYRYRDDRGNLIELEVTPDLKRALETIDQAFRRREQLRREGRWSTKEVNEAILAGSPRGPARFDLDEMADDPAHRTQLWVGANAWEGPRMGFTRFLGESVIWNGPPQRLADGRCPFCLGRELETHECCLGPCHRTGKDILIPSVTRADMAKRKPKQAPPADEVSVTLSVKCKANAKRKAKSLKGGAGSTDRRRRKVSALRREPGSYPRPPHVCNAVGTVS